MPQIQLQAAAIPGTWPPPAPSIAGGVVVSGLDGSTSAPGDPIVFALAPGQQYSVKYGSLVADTTKMQNSDVDPTGTRAETIPTFAPYRTISMVHAVQQPKPPSALSVTVAPRQAGDTSITLTGGFAVDGLTSQSVDFNASWAEFMDVEMGANIVEASDGTHRRLSLKQGRIQTWNLGTTDSAISFTTQGQQTMPPLHQEFGDTKTRMISFRATATSRFREFFPQSLQSSAANFQNSVPAAAFTEAQLLSSGTRIPSTARPIEPKILYVVPTFQWTSSTNATTKAVTNSRVGRGLRVFVDRPWYTTGDSEQLAVLVNPSGTAPTTIAAFVSQWGMDPTRNPQADSPGVLDQTQIVGGTLTGAVPLAELPGQSVSILAFNPSAFDPVRHLWYFDIEFAASAVEAPFVRLVLARFQANSLGGPAFPNASSGDLRMSTVVQADMVKLSADRTGTYIVNADGSTTVTVAGHVYGNIPTFPGSATLNANTVNPSLASGRMVYAQVMESTAATPGEFDWAPVGAAFLLQPTQLAGAPANSTALSFMGSVPKPSGLAAGAKHQLLITEHEVFATDAETAFPGSQQVSNFPPGTMPMRTNAAQTTPTTSRILFSDILALPY